MNERRIGGTDISKVVGINPYGGPRSVYERIVNGFNEPLNEAMQRGLDVEPLIRNLAPNYGITIFEPKPEVIQSIEYEFATASPDDFGTHAGLPVLLEYKSVSEWGAGAKYEDGRPKWGDTDWCDVVPDHYHLQVRWGMAVCGFERALLIASFGSGNDAATFIKWSHIYEFHRDLEIERKLLAAGHRFWTEHVVPKIPPPPDAVPQKRKPRKVSNG